MANLVGICGGSAENQTAFLSSVQPELTPFDGLAVHRSDFGKTVLVWSETPTTPVSVKATQERAAFVMGTLGAGCAQDAQNAAVVLETQRQKGAEFISGLNGYYLAVSEDENGVVTLGTDALGLFPLYYYSTPQLFIFSTTPSAFGHHPDFRSELSIEGLVGVLFANFLVGGQTLLKNVRRLSPGHALQWQTGAEAREIKSAFIVPSDRYFGNSFQKNLGLVDSLFQSIVEKNKNLSRPSMLLSGGLDSRLLAGYLDRTHGRQVRAVTQGNANDLEMRCARAVAKRLGWRHEIQPADPATFEEYADLKIEQEHLANGFNTPYFMQLVPKIWSFNSPIYTGVHGDSALGGGVIQRVFDPALGRCTFEKHLAHINKAGISAGDIRRLIPAGILGGALDAVIEKLRLTYNLCQGASFQRAWLFDLSVADRFQVGFIARMLSFGAWPVLPFVDKDLLDTVANLPLDHLNGRRIEREIVCQRFGRLAVLPLDRNSYDTSPVFGLRRLMQKNNLTPVEAFQALTAHAQAKLSAPVEENFSRFGGERRFYYRTFDVNGAGWRHIRRKAENSRPLLENFFDPKMVGELLPKDSVTVRAKDGIIGTEAMKLMLGFSLWAEKNLSQ